VEEIHNIAFIFTMETIEQHGIILHGIFNGYMIRFRDDGSSVEGLVPFPSMHLLHQHATTCYSQRIWTSLEMFWDLLVKTLNPYSQHQGDFAWKSQKVPYFPPEAWDYLSVCSFQRGLSVVVFHTRSLRSRLFGPMKASSFRVKRAAELLRFETPNDLHLFRSLFGELSTYGIRRRRAKIGQVLCITDNTAMHAVIGSETKEQVTWANMRTLLDGIDLLYDGVNLKVNVRYRCFLFESDATGLPVGLPTHFTTLFQRICESLPTDNESRDENHDCITIQIGSLFEYSDGLVYPITGVADDKSVDAVCLYPVSRKGTVVHFQNYLAISEAI
jgi:hypothetical protein